MPEQPSERDDSICEIGADVPTTPKDSTSGELASSNTHDNPPETQENSGQTTKVSETRIYQGPLPDPQLLEGYENVLPGSAKQIVEAFVEQSSHRRELERNQQWHSNARSWGGMACGFVLCCGVLGVSAYMVGQDHSVAALATVITSMSVLAGVFVFGKQAQVDELRKMRNRLEKRKQPQENESES